MIEGQDFTTATATTNFTVVPHASAGFAEAVRRWRNLLGTENVFLDAESLLRYAQSTLPTATYPCVVLKPANTQEVAELVKIAVEFRLPLFPVSRGKNWGYGNATAPRDGWVIVDLGRLNRILEVNEELGYAVLEPGVTQGQLFAYLAERNLPFLTPVHGGGPDCSVLGNALERGYGLTPIADHFQAVTSLEAVLPSGEIYRTPLAGMGAASLDHLHKWGIGPYSTGLFTQSNFGIVTRMTIQLAHKPSAVEAFVFTLREGCFEEAVPRVRSILAKLTGQISSINLMNAPRVLAMTVPYPHDRVTTQGCLPRAEYASLQRRHGVASWTGAGALYGEPAMNRVALQLIRRELKSCVKEFHSFNQSKIHAWKKMNSWLPWPGHASRVAKLAAAEGLLRIASGEPQRTALKLADWRNRRVKPGGISAGPQAGSGLIWFSPLVPAIPQLMKHYEQLVLDTCGEFGMEPLITFTSLSERLFDSTVPLLFDREDRAECERAQSCYAALVKLSQALGIVPYRVPHGDLSSLVIPQDTHWQLLSKFKQLVDPHGILAPGRYLSPSSTWESLS